MDIKEVKTAVKVGEFVLKTNHPNKIDIKYLSTLSQKDLKDDTPRVYLFVVDSVIKKIGGSISRGGIKATMSFYVNAMTGSPGPVRFIIHLLIEQALRKGSKVEVYMITSPKTLATINGLFGPKKVEISSFKEMENLCKSDYFSVEGKYPDWNFQENHEEYPPELAKKYVEYHQKRLSKK
ncbi:MAG: hypothetical protein QXG18_02330 [Candidatus Pacearchaeota archaeon]